MRRIAGLLLGLLVMATGLQAQVCSQVRSQRTILPGQMTVRGDTTVLVYVTQDSFRTRCVQPTKLKTDTLRLPGRVDTVYVTKPDTVKPPVDTVKPPPVDTVKPPPVDTTKPPAPAGVLFGKLWTTLPAENGPAVNGWTRWGGQGALAMVPSAGLGFPAGLASVLRVQMGTGKYDWLEVNGQWTLPAVGESRAYRLYYRNTTTTTGSNWASTHPVESKGTDGSISGRFYAWHIGTGGQWAFSPEGVGEPRNHYSLNPSNNDIGTLAKNETLRIEWKWTRTGPAVYSLDLRLYRQDGSLLADKSTIRAWGQGNPTLASNPTGFPVDDWAITGIRVGINGGYSASGTQYVYYGGFLVCTDWCGAY